MKKNSTNIRWEYIIIALILTPIAIWIWKDFHNLNNLSQARRIFIIPGIIYFGFAGLLRYSFSKEGIRISVACLSCAIIPWSRIDQMGVIMRRDRAPILVVTKVGHKRFSPNRSLFLYEVLHPFGVIIIDFQKNILDLVTPFYPELDYIINPGAGFFC